MAWALRIVVKFFVAEIRHQLGSGNFSEVRLGVDVKDKVRSQHMGHTSTLLVLSREEGMIHNSYQSSSRSSELSASNLGCSLGVHFHGSCQNDGSELGCNPYNN